MAQKELFYGEECGLKRNLISDITYFFEHLCTKECEAFLALPFIFRVFFNSAGSG
jgi:hypothetical protein